MNIYNTHIHTFMDKDIPMRYLPLGLVRLLANKSAFHIISKIFNNLNPFSDKDTFNRYIKFAEISKLGSQKKIFEECQKFYPHNSTFFVLSMDMTYMGAGNIKRNYKEQLDELADLKAAYPEQILPFIHIDPRREGYFDLFKHYINEKKFAGVKIYPSIGYFPYDERLYPIYEYCQINKIPIISHCSPHNPTYFKGSKTELKELLKKSKTPIDTKNKKNVELCANFAHPLNWEYVMQDFPQLHVCLAHFGSAEQWRLFLDTPDAKDNWFVTIKEMLKKWEFLYTDISFTLNQQEFFPLLKILMHNNQLNSKILFGSDYYMVETKSTERRFSIDLRAFVGEESFYRMAVENPKRFMFLIS